MDYDICFVCHRRIDFKELDRAFPHLAGECDHLPPEAMSSLEEDIYWGQICLECARAAEADLPAPPAPPPGRPGQGNLLLVRGTASPE